MVELEQVAIRLMHAMDLQGLLLDEVHNILAGTFREQRIVLNTLRYISNELEIWLVCFGVNQAGEAISGDVRLVRRLEEFPLTRWSAEDQFEDLVLAIVRNLSLRNPQMLPARAMRRDARHGAVADADCLGDLFHALSGHQAGAYDCLDLGAGLWAPKAHATGPWHGPAPRWRGCGSLPARTRRRHR